MWSSWCASTVVAHEDALNPARIPEVGNGQGDVTRAREEFARRLGERTLAQVQSVPES